MDSIAVVDGPWSRGFSLDHGSIPLRFSLPPRVTCGWTCSKSPGARGNLSAARHQYRALQASRPTGKEMNEIHAAWDAMA